MQLSQNELVVRDVKCLLKLFGALRKAVRTKPLRKNKELEEIAHKRATEELIAELKKREAGFTFPPGRFTQHRKSEAEQKIAQEQGNHVLEARAENKYHSMDKKYDAKLRERDKKIQLLIQKIDHTITPIGNELRQYAETDKTLLVADWPELRRKISVRDFITPEMQEQVDRIIIALEILMRRLRRVRTKSLIGAVKWFYEVTIKTLLDLVLDWISKSRS